MFHIFNSKLNNLDFLCRIIRGKISFTTRDFRVVDFEEKRREWVSNWYPPDAVKPRNGFSPFDVTNLNRLIGGALKFHTKIKDFHINGFRFTGNTLQ